MLDGWLIKYFLKSYCKICLSNLFQLRELLFVYKETLSIL